MSAVDPYAGLIIPDPTDEAVPGSAPYVWEPGTGGTFPGSAVPGTAREPGTGLYADVAAMLDGTLPEPPTPTVLACTDGVGLFYVGQVNLVFGDPESGKTWLCLAAASEALVESHRVAVLDLDHNGAAATVSRLLDLGAPAAAMRTLGQFRYVEPDDGMHLAAVVADLVAWRPRVVVIDSVGELLPLFGASSNSPDDFTRVHAAVMKPLARAGAAVLAVDHLAKNAESRTMGATGTAAKKRSVGGTSLRVTVAEQFAPGRGGAAHVAIAKDRHGGLRAARPTGDREPLAGTFRLYPPDSDRRWAVHAPAGGEHNPTEEVGRADLGALLALDPAPTSVEDARSRLGWRKQRAVDAMRAYRAVPGSQHMGTEPGTAPEPTLPEAVTRMERPTPPPGGACTECGELLSDPGATARCRDRHQGQGAA